MRVTKRDMDDAKALGERSGIDSMDDWDQFIHDIAQCIADGRRHDAPVVVARLDRTDPEGGIPGRQL